jgi:hypothetical protein
MSDPSNVAKSLRERLGGNTEDRLGKALSDLLENPLLTGAIGRAFDAREKASQAQEVAFGALNIPSAADIERLTRRLRSVSHRLEGIEDGVDRLDRALSPSGVEARLAAIEAQLRILTGRIEQLLRPSSTPASAAAAAPSGTAKAPSRRAKAPSGTANAPSRRANAPSGKAKAPSSRAKAQPGKAKAAARKAKAVS